MNPEHVYAYNILEPPIQNAINRVLDGIRSGDSGRMYIATLPL